MDGSRRSITPQAGFGSGGLSVVPTPACPSSAAVKLGFPGNYHCRQASSVPSSILTDVGGVGRPAGSASPCIIPRSAPAAAMPLQSPAISYRPTVITQLTPTVKCRAFGADSACLPVHGTPFDFAIRGVAVPVTSQSLVPLPVMQAWVAMPVSQSLGPSPVMQTPLLCEATSGGSAVSRELMSSRCSTPVRQAGAASRSSSVTRPQESTSTPRFEAVDSLTTPVPTVRFVLHSPSLPPRLSLRLPSPSFGHQSPVSFRRSPTISSPSAMRRHSAPAPRERLAASVLVRAPTAQQKQIATAASGKRTDGTCGGTPCGSPRTPRTTLRAGCELVPLGTLGIGTRLLSDTVLEGPMARDCGIGLGSTPCLPSPLFPMPHVCPKITALPVPRIADARLLSPRFGDQKPRSMEPSSLREAMPGSLAAPVVIYTPRVPWQVGTDAPGLLKGTTQLASASSTSQARSQSPLSRPSKAAVAGPELSVDAETPPSSPSLRAGWRSGRQRNSSVLQGLSSGRATHAEHRATFAEQIGFSEKCLSLQRKLGICCEDKQCVTSL